MTKLEHGGLLDSASIAVADFLEIAAQSVHGHKAIPEWERNRWLIEYYKDQVEGSREFESDIYHTGGILSRAETSHLWATEQ